jgi:hypothetical protein
MLLTAITMFQSMLWIDNVNRKTKIYPGKLSRIKMLAKTIDSGSTINNIDSKATPSETSSEATIGLVARLLFEDGSIRRSVTLQSITQLTRIRVIPLVYCTLRMRR